MTIGNSLSLIALNGKRYSSFPGHLSDPFLAHVKAGNRPDRFPGLCTDRVPRDVEYQIISKCYYRPKMGEDRLTCAMCTPNRFLDGRLIWIPSYERVAVIGHECANERQQGFAENGFVREQNRRHWEECLEDDLTKLGAIKAIWVKNACIGQLAVAAKRNFRRQFPVLFKQLDQQRRKGNGLTIETEISEPQVGKLTAVDVRNFGTLSGDDFLKSTFDPAKRLREQGAVLEAIENPGANREAAFDQIVNMSYGNLDWAYSQLRKAKSVDEKARTEVAAAYEFFNEENFMRIGKWLAAHEQARVSGLSWSKNDGVVRVTCREDGALMTMRMQHSELAKWNSLPQLRCF